MHSLRRPRSALSTQCFAIFRDPLFKSFRPAISQAQKIVIFRQLWFQLDGTAQMFDRIGILSLAKEILPKSCPRLPCVRIFRESIAPEHFFIVKNFGRCHAYAPIIAINRMAIAAIAVLISRRARLANIATAEQTNAINETSAKYWR